MYAVCRSPGSASSGSACIQHQQRTSQVGAPRAPWNGFERCQNYFAPLTSCSPAWAHLHAVCRFNPGVKEQQLFSFNLSQPFQKGRGWLAWALLGIAGAPLVVGATAAALSAISYETVTSGGRGTADGVAGMISMDTVTYVKLLIVTGEECSLLMH
eukprot:GHRR01033099.1.p1 GENE.GHRR01033099.1~~GHRR01033099.1.p1  ORF type:complete len:156 (+),score=51.88 GHRR01033099.1:202-669(+)